MKNNFKFEDIVQQIMDILPSDPGQVRADIKKNIKAILQATFSRVDLVSREEFDIQSELLARTRIQLEDLKEKITTLEKSGNSDAKD